MNFRSLLVCLVTLGLVISTSAFLSACSSSGGYGRSSIHYGVGYGGYYGRPWGYDPVYVGGGIDPDSGADAPVASQLPEMGMPDYGGDMDMGGMDMDMDMGGFDW
jgi:hypothetical protein